VIISQFFKPFNLFNLFKSHKLKKKAPRVWVTLREVVKLGFELGSTQL
jgi:hypothetical protein